MNGIATAQFGRGSTGTLAAPQSMETHQEISDEYFLELAAKPLNYQQLVQIEQGLSEAAEELGYSASRAILLDSLKNVQDKGYQSEPLTGAELVALVMDLSLKAGERQRDMREQVLPVIAATAIAIQAISHQGINSAFTGEVMQSVQALLDGAKDLASGSHLKPAAGGLGCMGNIVGNNATPHTLMSHLQECVADTAKHYLEQSSQRVEGELSMSDAFLQEESSLLQQLVNNGNRIAMMIASATEIYNPRK